MEIEDFRVWKAKHMTGAAIIAWLVPLTLFAASLLILLIALVPPCGRPC